ncbi:MAG: hypothetical protein U0610_02210 [bacterium]
MYQVELKDGRILSMNARDVKTFRPLIRAFMLARPTATASARAADHAPTRRRLDSRHLVH